MPVLMNSRTENREEFGRIYNSFINDDKYIWMDEMSIFGYPDVYFINYEDYILHKNEDIKNLPENSIRYISWCRYGECCPLERTEVKIDIEGDNLAKSLDAVTLGSDYCNLLKSQIELDRDEVYPEEE